MIHRTVVDKFSDLVEGQRRMEVSVCVGMIHFQFVGGRPNSAESFRLDSECVDELITALTAARDIVRGSGGR